MPSNRLSVTTICLLIAGFGAATWMPSRAHAQSSNPPGRDESGDHADASAQEHYRLGAEAFREGDHESALHHFRKAYEMKPNGMLLYNLALVHTAAGRPEKALWHAEKADSSGELTENARVRNTSRLQALRVAVSGRSLAEQRAERLVSDATPEPEPTEQREEPSPTPHLSDDDRSTSAHPLFWGSLSLAGLGLGALGSAAALELSLRDDVEQYRNAARTGQRQKYRKLGKSIERRQRIGRALLVGGAIATGVGTLLAAVDVSTRGKPAVFQFGAAPAPRSGHGFLLTVSAAH